MGICVYWYPVINYPNLRRFEIEQCVSDSGYPEVYLKISITHLETSIEDAQTKSDLIERPITVECYKKESNGKKTPVFTTFTLEYKNHSRNGMVVYEYEEPKDYPKDEQSLPFEEFLTGVCYHHVKSLFYSYEIQSDRDYYLKAYLPEGKFDINSIRHVDNDALIYFLKQYEKNISLSVELIVKRRQVYDDAESRIKKHIYLVQYGWKDFRRWYSNPAHQDEVETLKKDILKWSLLLKPLNKKRISRNLSSYEKRIKIIINNINGRIEKSEKKNYYYDLLDRTKYVAEAVIRNVQLRGKKSDYHFYLYELEPINTILNEIEIELGIYKHQFYYELSFFLYSQLNKLILNFNKICRDTNIVLYKLCEDASVKYSYCKTLLDGKSDWELKKSCSEYVSEQDLDNRRTELNINNSIYHIEMEKERITYTQINNIFPVLENADKVSQTTTKISYIGLAITFLSLIISLISVNWDYSNMQNQTRNNTSIEVVNSPVIKSDTEKQKSSLFDYRSERRID